MRGFDTKARSIGILENGWDRVWSTTSVGRLLSVQDVADERVDSDDGLPWQPQYGCGEQKIQRISLSIDIAFYASSVRPLRIH